MKSYVKSLQLIEGVTLSHWAELLRLRRLVIKKGEHEDIHDLRVASRRFRSALKILAPVCGRMETGKLSRKVQKLTRTLGKVRNLDEALSFFGSKAGESDLTTLIKRLADSRSSEEDRILKILKHFKVDKLDKRVHQLVRTTEEKTRKQDTSALQSHIRAAAIRLYDNVQESLPPALIPENAEERHTLRISIKKWRYFLEIHSTITEQNHDEVLKQLKSYQSLLGSMNDMTVFAGMCREAKVSKDVLADAEQLIALENNKLFDQFITLVNAEPLKYDA
ncbi:CHAD domain-containing protein [Pelotalea chapellei]|uniref:CHAD domain-containing protein n=1 Tax=Pelotalea chapellei TaxID=44671 RepID=A0ABS5U5W7_9BACT|nr:CHAD domain-containing protein [Pelotalea chapellei]MBT1071062.1 CHAD domain-containing protein [Pelotalea chapellei]